MIVDETDRIARVVTGLTELGRPRPPALETVTLGPLLDRAADFVEGEADACGVAITRDLGRTLRSAAIPTRCTRSPSISW